MRDPLTPAALRALLAERLPPESWDLTEREPGVVLHEVAHWMEFGEPLKYLPPTLGALADEVTHRCTSVVMSLPYDGPRCVRRGRRRLLRREARALAIHRRAVPRCYPRHFAHQLAHRLRDVLKGETHADRVREVRAMVDAAAQTATVQRLGLRLRRWLLREINQGASRG